MVGYEKLPSSVLAAVRDYINLNYDVLLAYWNDELSTSEMVTGLKRL